MSVRLRPLTDALLASLTDAAVHGAAPGEVMPPVADDPEPGTGAWTPLRRAAFTAFHRDQSLAPHAPQATYAITVDTPSPPADRPASRGAPEAAAGGVAGDSARPREEVVGAARLAPVLGEPDTVEAGLWIVRDQRARGIGRAVLRDLRETARASGASRLLARTSAGNTASRRLLASVLGPPEPVPGDPGSYQSSCPLPSVAALLMADPPMAGPLPALDPATAPELPGQLFAAWLAEAAAVPVPAVAVATLSTVDGAGRPDARVLLLRDVDAEGANWTFATNRDSAKGRQLAARPTAALTLYWDALGRQIRVRGEVRDQGPERAAADFRSRSPRSRAAALTGHQSQPMPSLAAYDTAAEEARRQLAAEPDTVPPGHTVYALHATEVEFWQGASSRRHIRLRYTRDGPGRWQLGLRWP